MAERLEVHAIDAIGERLYERHFGLPRFALRDAIRSLMAEVATAVTAKKPGVGLPPAEWDELVDAWQLDRWQAHREGKRLGRKTRLPQAQRAAPWPRASRSARWP